MWYNGDEYFYIRNLQGDIIALVNDMGDIVAKYSYDAWGNPISITDGQGNDVSNDPYHIANINPYRYRGYRYDTETGFYSLQSRYYDPEIGRFISMDDTKILMLTQGELLGANLFAYCGNNPVMYSDSSGYLSISSVAKTIWKVLNMILPYLNLVGLASSFAGYFVPWLGQSRLIVKIIATAYYAFNIMSNISTMLNKKINKYFRVQALGDAVYNFIKGISVWAKVKVDKLFNNSKVILETLKAMDKVLGTAFFGARYLIQIGTGKYYF